MLQSSTVRFFTFTNMALVAYDYSDTSDVEEDDANAPVAALNSTQSGKITILPAVPS